MVSQYKVTYKFEYNWKEDEKVMLTRTRGFFKTLEELPDEVKTKEEAALYFTESLVLGIFLELESLVEAKVPNIFFSEEYIEEATVDVVNYDIPKKPNVDRRIG